MPPLMVSFTRISVDATESLAELAVEHGVQHIVYTSTTALYEYALTPEGHAGWINEDVQPLPRTIYHRTKIEAEQLLERFSLKKNIPVTILQMSRCFPEPADLMCVYRLNRGIDVRDVAEAHRLAISRRRSGFRRYIVSGATPFQPEHCSQLHHSADLLIRELAPSLAAEFDKRGWQLPKKVDRVYDLGSAQRE